jgi:hypothetical protein
MSGSQSDAGLVPFEPAPGRVKDALQVEAQVRFFGEQDHGDQLRRLFEAPSRLPTSALHEVVSEEGWILGVL